MMSGGSRKGNIVPLACICFCKSGSPALMPIKSKYKHGVVVIQNNLCSIKKLLSY